MADLNIDFDLNIVELSIVFVVELITVFVVNAYTADAHAVNVSCVASASNVECYADFADAITTVWFEDAVYAWPNAFTFAAWSYDTHTVRSASIKDTYV